MPSVNNGSLITFEGIDGVGKTTIVNAVSKKLSELNLKPYVASETATDIGSKLRKIIMDSPLHGKTRALLFAAMRNEYLTTVIKPLLRDHENIVLYDRYTHSSITYSIYADKVAKAQVHQLQSIVIQNYKPSMVVYISADENTRQKRMSTRDQIDRYESDKTQRNVEQGYLELLSDTPYPVLHIDTSHTPIEENVNRIVQRIVRLRKYSTYDTFITKNNLYVKYNAQVDSFEVYTLVDRRLITSFYHKKDAFAFVNNSKEYRNNQSVRKLLSAKTII